MFFYQGALTAVHGTLGKNPEVLTIILCYCIQLIFFKNPNIKHLQLFLPEKQCTDPIQYLLCILMQITVNMTNTFKKNTNEINCFNFFR